MNRVGFQQKAIKLTLKYLQRNYKWMCLHNEIVLGWCNNKGGCNFMTKSSKT